MKKLLFGLMAIAAMGFAQSCNKASSPAPETGVRIKATSSNSGSHSVALSGSNNLLTRVTGAEDDDLRVYYDNGGSDYGCTGSGGNCLPDVIITPKLSLVIQNLINAISNNNTIAFVVENNDDLVSLVSPIALDAVVNEGYGLAVKGSSQSSTQYLVFSNTNGVVELVYPFIAR